MKIIIIAGGIGAGKTAVTDHLRDRGFTVIDADVVAHRITDRGQPALGALRDAFGDGILKEDGSLDRAFVADIVFHDRSALRRLNSITHGHVGSEIVDELHHATGPVAFIALPLFRPEHRDFFNVDQVWAVQVSPATALERLIHLRDFSEADAASRLANQMTNEERAQIVDRVVWNEGTLDDLLTTVDEMVDKLGDHVG